VAANDIADLLLKIDATTEGLRREMKKADQTVAGFSKNTDRKLSSVDQRFAKMGVAVKKAAGVMATALAAAGLAKLTSDMVSVNAESQRLRASLETVTGSVENANAAWEMLEQFAATTPFQLEQSVNAFVKMKALGLDPTERALTSFGNTAAAMGKDLNQMIEAVADASTSEFERLKEFGIKARQQGDQVSLTFQGVTTTIGNNAAEIVGYLEDIGNQEFAGAMERQMDTLNGAFSNLGDSTDRLIRKIGESGANEGLTGALNWLTDQMNAVTNAIDGPTVDAVTQQILEIDAALEGLGSGRRADGKRAYLNAQLEDLQGQLARLKASDGDVQAINNRLAELNAELAALEGGTDANPRAARNTDRRISELKGEIEDLNATLEFSQPIEDFEINIASVGDKADESAKQVDVLDEVLGDIGMSFAASAQTADESWGDFMSSGWFQELTGQIESVSVATEDVAVKNEEAATRTRTAWDDALQDTAARIDESFAQAWRGAFDSFDSFADSLLDSFKNLLAEMAHLAITRPIIMQVGTAFGIGAPAAGAVGIGSSASSLASGFAGLGSGAYNLLADGAYAIGLDSLGLNARGSVGMGLGGQALNLGAGIAGGYLGNEVFGPTTGIGSTALGFVGSAFGPIGAAIGAFLGSGLESLFGGGKPNQNITSARFASNDWADMSAGQTSIFDYGSAETDQTVMGIAQSLNQFRQILGGSIQDIVYSVGDQGGLYLAPGRGEGAGDGPNYNGYTFNYGDDIAGFLDHAFDQMVSGAIGLTDSLKTLVLEFDGTTEETMAVAQAAVLLSDDFMSLIHSVKEAGGESMTMAQAATVLGEDLHSLLTSFGGASEQSITAALSVLKLDEELKHLVLSFGGTSQETMAVAQAAIALSDDFMSLIESVKDAGGESMTMAQAATVLSGDLKTLLDSFGGASEQSIVTALSVLKLDEDLKNLVLSFDGTAQQTLVMAQAVTKLDDQIKQNPVRAAIEEFAAAQAAASLSLWDSYQSQLSAVQTLAINFDGSAASAVEMSNALQVSQGMAYQMTIALMDVSDQIGVMFANSAEQIRESVLTEDQRIAKWKAERDLLQSGLESISDPEALLEAAGDINRLNMQIFQSLENATAETAETFASFAEETDRIAQERIDEILSDLESSQSTQMDLVGDVLRGAAEQQIG